MNATTTTPEQLAQKFIELLRKEIGYHSFAEACRRNNTREYQQRDICASHDFCDANVVMAAAFEAFGIVVDVDDDAQIALWSRAWHLAHAEMAARHRRSERPNDFVLLGHDANGRELWRELPEPTAEPMTATRVANARRRVRLRVLRTDGSWRTFQHVTGSMLSAEQEAANLVLACSGQLNPYRSLYGTRTASAALSEAWLSVPLNIFDNSEQAIRAVLSNWTNARIVALEPKR